MTNAFDLNLRHLRGVAAIVRAGSVSAAAQLISLSQPALTQGVAKLEAQLSTPLFTRQAGGMEPTEAGRALAARTGAAFAHLAAAVRGGRRFANAERLMTATQLRAFLALADAGSFVGAASATALSQPAIHRAVRDLEQVCGQVLVERRGRGIALSAGGLRLARGIRLARAEIAGGIAELTAREGGSVVIGAMPLSRAMLVPRAIARTVAVAPEIEIDVIEGSWRELVEALRDGAIDLTIGALRPEPGPPDLTQTPLMTDRLMIVGRAGHPLAGAATPTPGQLAAYPWVVSHAGAPLRTLWERLFGAGPLPRAPVHCGSVMVIRGILAESDFLTLLSPEQIALEVDSGVLAAIGPEPALSGRTIGVTTRRDWRPTRAQSRFLEALDQVAGPARGA
ncbi:LysR substrate-binding domain-containing protein [Sphingomonas sp. BAUL-RG-20F-R05-02]|uniref:LysR substrate-binding domain-containing protein n=1 Tax=Sphingomonas sp. BAUL-RG-20F-R05-02 TaxID=2914830 RepID=UPI001F5A2D4C|nr:LysR substrate-binding domain-containing protein [Sphingomonas sp. BAUL-RG-20F-R05-02]